MAEKDCPATEVTGPGRLLPPCPHPSPRVAPRNRAQRHPGFDAPTMTRGRSCLRTGFCCGGSSAVSDAIERRGKRRPVARGRSHPPACAPCRPPRPPCADVLRGGLTAPPVGVARSRRAAAAAMAAAVPLSMTHAPPATATWLYAPPCALPAMELAGVSGVDASPSAPPP